MLLTESVDSHVINAENRKHLCLKGYDGWVQYLAFEDLHDELVDKCA